MAPGCLPSRRSPLFTARDAPEPKSGHFFGVANGILLYNAFPSPLKERWIKGVRLINNPFH